MKAPSSETRAVGTAAPEDPQKAHSLDSPLDSMKSRIPSSEKHSTQTGSSSDERSSSKVSFTRRRNLPRTPWLKERGPPTAARPLEQITQDGQDARARHR